MSGCIGKAVASDAEDCGFNQRIWTTIEEWPRENIRENNSALI